MESKASLVDENAQLKRALEEAQIMRSANDEELAALLQAMHASEEVNFQRRRKACEDACVVAHDECGGRRGKRLTVILNTVTARF